VTEKVGHLGFNDDDEALVVFLAALASGAIDSALLVESERTRTEAVAARAAAEDRERTRRETLGKVIEAQEAERARVSRDLHDDIGQALTSVLLGLRLVDANVHDPTGDIGETRRRLDDLRGLATDALRRSRQLAFNLRPTVLDDIGLVPALERLTTDLAAGSGLTIELIDQLPDGDRLPPAIEITAYRVTQEALTNVVRHADASAASVILTNVGNSVQVVVSDDGRGFDVETQPQGLGLAGMAERVALAGGQLTVSARLGYGTTVMFEAPVG
jgi:signal transduction histidine kinase